LDFEIVHVIVAVAPEVLRRDMNQVRLVAAPSTSGHPLWRPLAVSRVGFRFYP